MKKILLMMMFVGSSLCGFSQSSFVSAGGDSSSPKGSLSGSIGQVSTKYATSSVGSVSQGVQVVYDVLTVGIDNYPLISLQMEVFPNPTVSGVSLSMADSQEIGGCSAKLYDATGKTLQVLEIIDAKTYIQMQNYIPGIYYLNVCKKNTVLKNFKIIKK